MRKRNESVRKGLDVEMGAVIKGEIQKRLGQLTQRFGYILAVTSYWEMNPSFCGAPY